MSKVSFETFFDFTHAIIQGEKFEQWKILIFTTIIQSLKIMD